MTKLSVNLNAVAQLRNRRDLPWPSVTAIARIALDAGAVGVTVHPRPDERHIRRSDVFDLVNLLRTEYPTSELNIEGYPSEGHPKVRSPYLDSSRQILDPGPDPQVHRSA